MPVFILEDSLTFPPVELAEPDGLLAIGGDLSPERLLKAYPSGIFPWYEGEHILWWCPDPRFVLFPRDIIISHSMRSLIKKNFFRFSVNTSFKQVIRLCKQIRRNGQFGTWITDEVESAYNLLHQLGYAISAEAWKNDELVGGLYGVKIGNVFFGESMFSKEPNASKFAFIKLVDLLREKGTVLIDCQVYTSHLESLGARMIQRKDFLELLKNNC